MIGFNENYWPNEAQMLLLKAALCEHPIALKAWEAWGVDIDINDCDAFSYQLMAKIYKNLSIGGVFRYREVIKGIYKRTWLNNQLLLTAFSKTMQDCPTSLTDQILLMKGAAMIAGYYHDPGVRVIGDIDILVPKESAILFIRYLLENGYKSTDPLGQFDTLSSERIFLKHAVSFTKENSSPALIIDVHVTPLVEIYSSHPEQKEWFKSPSLLTLNELETQALNATNLLFQTCVHGVKYSQVPLLRWVIDATTILNHAHHDIDWNALLQKAQHYELVIPLRNALTFLANHFTSNIPRSVLNQLDKLPCSKLDQLEYNYKAKSVGRIRYALIFYWFQSRRQKKSFIRYLQHLWGLRFPFQVPWVFCIKSIKFLMRKTRI